MISGETVKKACDITEAKYEYIWSKLPRNRFVILCNLWVDIKHCAFCMMVSKTEDNAEDSKCLECPVYKVLDRRCYDTTHNFVNKQHDGLATILFIIKSIRMCEVLKK